MYLFPFVSETTEAISIYLKQLQQAVAKVKTDGSARHTQRNHNLSDFTNLNKSDVKQLTLIYTISRKQLKRVQYFDLIVFTVTKL